MNCLALRARRQLRRAALALAATISVAASASADTIISEFLPLVGPTTPGQWYLSDIRNGGTASIESLVGLGGDLENNQPLPIGAALLTTGMDNGDKAEVGTFADFGDASSVLNAIELAYSYYKQTVVDGNAFAAPSLKLTIAAEGGTGDNYGVLTFEPYWNQPGGGAPPAPADAWQNVVIDSMTGGGGVEGSAGWWWSGGFEIANSAGGPPLRSLQEWATAFAASDPVDFATARVVGLSVGVGTYNQGQIGYFDAVSYSIIGGPSETFNFEPVPEPGTMALAMCGVAAAVLVVRRVRR